jgi:hypothetical protein
LRKSATSAGENSRSYRSAQENRPVHPPSGIEYDFAVSKPSGEIIAVQAIYPSLYRANGELFLSTKVAYSSLKAVLDNVPFDES